MTASCKRPLDLERYSDVVKSVNSMRMNGKVSQVVGIIVESRGPSAHLGEICEIRCRRDRRPVLAEVVGFTEDRVLLMPLGELEEIAPGSDVIATRSQLRNKVGKNLDGRVLDGQVRPIDGKGPLETDLEMVVARTPPNPMDRVRIHEPLPLGIRSIDSLLTCGKGQREAASARARFSA